MGASSRSERGFLELERRRLVLRGRQATRVERWDSELAKE